VAAHAVQVNADLLRSRAALVTAREEERRRLRRDLHDGLGPALAGVTLGLHAARATLKRDLASSEELLVILESQMEEAVGDIRQLVYGLRPPALDEVGLVRALQQQAARLEGTAGLVVSVEAIPPHFAQLPAAVEVAAYRIAMEAMTNTARHANASLCSVLIRVGDSLELTVTDNGVGLADESSPGVGLNSMRERAGELGGGLEIESSTAGTAVTATLPVVHLDE
jgi:signal transduction histidine kinase